MSVDEYKYFISVGERAAYIVCMSGTEHEAAGTSGTVKKIKSWI